MAFVRELKVDELKERRIIGQNIKNARISQNMTLDYVARELRFPKSKLSEVEAGAINLNAVLLGRLADILMVSPSYFFNGKESEIGREKLFDFSRVCQKNWEKATEKYAEACFEILAGAFPASEELEKFLNCSEEFIARSRNLIDKNRDEAWQDMKGGSNFEILLNHFSYHYRMAKQAMHNKRMVDKKIKEDVQMGLDF